MTACTARHKRRCRSGDRDPAVSRDVIVRGGCGHPTGMQRRRVARVGAFWYRHHVTSRARLVLGLLPLVGCGAQTHSQSVGVSRGARETPATAPAHNAVAPTRSETANLDEPTKRLAEPTAPTPDPPAPKTPPRAPFVAISGNTWIYTEPSPNAVRFRMERKLPPADHRAAAKSDSYVNRAPRRVVALKFDKDLGNGWFQVGPADHEPCGYRGIAMAGPLYLQVRDLLPLLAEPWRGEGADGSWLELSRGVALRPGPKGHYRAETGDVSVVVPATAVSTTRRVVPPADADWGRRGDNSAKGPLQLDAGGRSVSIHDMQIWLRRSGSASGGDRLAFYSQCVRALGTGTFRAATQQDVANASAFWSRSGVVGGAASGGRPYAYVAGGAEVFRENGQRVGQLSASRDQLVRPRTKVTFDNGRACLRHAEILGVHEKACIPLSDYEAAQSGKEPKPSTTVAEVKPGDLEALAIYAPEPDPKKLAGTKSAIVEKVRRKVTVKYCVTTLGRTVDVAIARKSGDAKVDQIVRDTVRKWRFRPPQDKRCTNKTFTFRFDMP